MSSNNSKAAVSFDSVAAEAKIHELFKGSLDEDYQGWERGMLLKEGKLISAASKPTGRAIFEFTCGPKHVNRLGNMHGGCTATLFDATTTAAVLPNSKPGFWSTAGVSRTLNVTYLRPIPQGTTIIIENEVVHAGKRLSTIKGTMKRKSDGAILAICEHGKVNIDAELGIGAKL